ncbi:MAG: hypothetical protein IH600_07940 [Bacteroidetes bacterium]|nr:hypothetical protein [Bacteroidota bacterium]
MNPITASRTTFPTVRDLPRPLRHLLAAFLITGMIGFTLGAFFVDHTTGTAPSGIAERFRGSEGIGVDLEQMPAEREIQYEKSPSEMLNVTHTHILALSMLFLLTGGIFSLATGIPPRLKAFLIIEPFVSLIVTFGGMWLVRYHHPGWGYVIAASGLLMAGCYYVMVCVGVYQLMRR